MTGHISHAVQKRQQSIAELVRLLIVTRCHQLHLYVYTVCPLRDNTWAHLAVMSQKLLRFLQIDYRFIDVSIKTSQSCGD